VTFKRGTIWNLLIPKERPVQVTKPAPAASAAAAGSATPQ